METAILDIIENGILIINKDLDILFWNRWMAIQTGISAGKAQGSRLDQLFPDTAFSLLKRKIRIALKINSSTFTNSSVEKYVIPIELKRITKSVFRRMRQDVVITPLNATDVSVIIYDATPLLEARTIIDEQLKLVEKQARTDGLTQIYNKNMFNELLSMEVKKADRHDHIFSLIVFDIDNFKRVNDTHGHLAGDHVLRELSALASRVVRESDILARWGGEEFCILLPETGLRGAAVVADKVRQAIEVHDFGAPGHQHCSFGVAQYPIGVPENTLIACADRALYHAKLNGKNQVAVFDMDTTVTWYPAPDA
ncbi:MAG: sensor domain-containing diguanylate cyclase [Pseudomonadota bacterium]